MAARASYRLALIGSLCLLITALGAHAQTTDRSGVEGRITDESGGVLPGVTVGLRSPALQVQELTAVTDVEGRYRFTALPPGTYSASYTLEGFKSVNRGDLRLSAGFVATVDVKLFIGDLKETITVTGTSPVVDVRTTSVSTNFSKEALETIPTSRSMWQILSLSPGVRVTSTTPDVGGNSVGTQQGYANYGTSGGGQRPTIDGVDTRENVDAAGFYYDFGAFEEVQIKAMGNDAEVNAPGTNFVGIIKSGGNLFHGKGLYQWEPSNLQSDNLDDALRAAGIKLGNPLIQYFDSNADLGGRLVRDRLWFYGAARRQRIRTGLIGYMKSPGSDGTYGTADDIPGEYRVDMYNYTSKLTQQLTNKHKLVVFFQYNKKDYPERDGDAFTPAEATARNLFVPYAAKGEWTWVPTSRSLVDFFVARAYFKASYMPYTNADSTFDTVTLRWGGEAVKVLNSDPEPDSSRRSRYQYNGSYTHFIPGRLGDHDVKIGFEFTREYYLKEDDARDGGNDYLLQLANGAPFQIILYNTPFVSDNRMNQQSGYIKDNWRIGNRLTFNLGLRLERYHVFLPPQSKPAGVFSQAASFPAADILTWKGIAPRVAFSYALTSDAKTVVKATYGRFNWLTAADYARTYNKNDLIQTTYRWNDQNGNRTYDAGELGAFVSATGASSSVVNPDLQQPKVHEFTSTLERELMGEFSARASYIFKHETDLYQNVNVLRPASAFNIPITTIDPGPDGKVGTADDGGSVTYYDYDPAYRGSAFERLVDQNTDGYSNSYHNIELVANKRLSHRWQMLASLLATHRDVWIAGIPQDPNASIFPKDQTWERLIRLSGSYLLPFNLQVAAFFSSQSGVAYARDVRFTTGLKQLTQVIVRMEPVGAERRPTQNLLSFRLEKRQRLGAGEASFQFDLFNVLNRNSAANISGRSGPTYGVISAIIPPRVARLGVTYSF